MSSASSFPRPLTGSLQLYQKKPVALPYFDSDTELPHSLVFIPGLTDTIGTIPYLPLLADAIGKHGFSLVQPQLTCNLGGYGQCTLEGDAQEIAACVAHLRSLPAKRNGIVILMGHSTGCQDSIAYLLSSVRATDPLTRIDGVILQAPVSDREAYEQDRKLAKSQQARDEMDAELQRATELVHSSQGATLLPRKDGASSTLPTTPTHLRHPMGEARENLQNGNASAVLSPAITAYRAWSLRAKGGHDDFFSSDLEDSLIASTEPGARTMGRAISNLLASTASGPTKQPRILALIGEKDEYVPDGVADILARRWSQLFNDTGAFTATILKEANHQAASPTATEHLIQVIDEYLNDLK